MVKIKEIRDAIKFNEYRDYLIGKYYRTYFNTTDKIINVILKDGIEYLVLDVKSNELRRHTTIINKNALLTNFPSQEDKR